jgi:DNA-binding MarR family transcriptional regulator
MVKASDLLTWVSASGAGRQRHLKEYFRGIAQARYTVRRVFRIVDEQARRAGLDPLQHQALIQIFGAGEAALRVNDVAERLDIAPAFASRLVRELAAKGLVSRDASDTDRRITLVSVSDAGRELLAQIDRDVHVHVTYFQSQLSEEERLAALVIFAFYVGVSLEDEDVKAFDAIVKNALRRNNR